jgi:hypothetical protein
MQRLRWCGSCMRNGSGLPRRDVRAVQMRCAVCCSRRGPGPHGWGCRATSGCRTNKPRSSPGSRPSFLGARIGMASIICCATSPSLGWRRRVTPRSRCAAQYAGGVPWNVRCCSHGGASLARPPLVPLPRRPLLLHHRRTSGPRPSPSRPTRLRLLVRWCWIPVAPCVAYAMTIRAERSNRPADAWRRPWETFGLRSNATWMPTVGAARTPNSSAWPPVSTAAWPMYKWHPRSSVSPCRSSSVSRPR